MIASKSNLTSSAAIDFTELPQKPPGESFEKVVREIGMQLGLQPRWSGRGADHGRDLIFTEIQKGPLGSRIVKWLVNCKDFSHSGRAVSESDVGSVIDKSTQHGADGFLLATTTTVGAALKEKLDALDARPDVHVSTRVWDSNELSLVLLKPELADVLKMYFPQSFRRLNTLGGPEAALLALQQQLPPNVAAQVDSLVRPHLIRRSSISGSLIWEYDLAAGERIDVVLAHLLDRANVVEAARSIGDLDYDAFMAMLGKLHDVYPDEEYEFLREVIRTHDDADVSFNAFQFLRDHYEFRPGDEIDLAARLDEDSLRILYEGEIIAFLDDEVVQNATAYHFWNDLDCLSNSTTVNAMLMDELNIWGNDRQVSFSGDVVIEVTLGYGSGDDAVSSPNSFPGRFEGYFDESGMHLESITVDTSSFYHDGKDSAVEDEAEDENTEAGKEEY